MAIMVEKEVKLGRFATKSEFFRSLLRMWEENNLLAELKGSQKEFTDGKRKALKSLKNLH